MEGRSWLDFERINREGLARAKSLLPLLVPGGKFEGNEYVVRNPRRVDHNLGSFKFNIETGKWSYFATDDKGQGLISYLKYVRGTGAKEAAKELADRLYLIPESEQLGPRPAKLKPQDDGDGWVPILPVPADQEVPKEILKRFDDHYAYRGLDGSLLGYTLRKNKKAGKDYYPLTFCRNTKTGKHEWRRKAFSVPRPLFGLEKLGTNPDGKVIVAEGEKTALAAQQLFPNFVAVTSSGGAKAARLADWTPLAGREVVMAPDHDPAGFQYAEDVMRQLYKVGVRSFYQLGWYKTRILREGNLMKPTGELLPEGYDLADVVSDGWTADLIEEAIKATADSDAPLLSKIIPRRGGLKPRLAPSFAP